MSLDVRSRAGDPSLQFSSGRPDFAYPCCTHQVGGMIAQFTASQATLVLDLTALLRWMVNEPGEPAVIVTPRTYRPVMLPWIVARTKLAEVSGRLWVTCDLPAGTVATPLRENAATPFTLSAGPPPVFWARTPTPCCEPATPNTPVVPLPSTPVPVVTFPNTPMPPCEV